MPISIVVGGQYGSEGKGKAALSLVRSDPSTTMVVRPGGTNSGHTAFTHSGRRLVLRQLPAAAIDGMVKVVFPAGSYIDAELLQHELRETGLEPAKVIVDPRAHVIRREHIAWETDARLVDSIGSTNSGTGAAVMARLARYATQHPAGIPASEAPELQQYLAETAEAMSRALESGQRILVEGTQGFGLSVLHTDTWPKCTSRDTTAAGFLSETGLGPTHVDRVFLVLRCHPIRVAGDSGPLPNETTWDEIAHLAGIADDLREFTSVTNKLRRVGNFDAGVVRRAIIANSPTDIILNHLDYVDGQVRGANILTARAASFVRAVEGSIGRLVDWIGTDDKSIIRSAETAVA